MLPDLVKIDFLDFTMKTSSPLDDSRLSARYYGTHFLTYKWAQSAKVLNYSGLERLARENSIAYWAHL